MYFVYKSENEILRLSVPPILTYTSSDTKLSPILAGLVKIVCVDMDSLLLFIFCISEPFAKNEVPTDLPRTLHG